MTALSPLQGLPAEIPGPLSNIVSQLSKAMNSETKPDGSKSEQPAASGVEKAVEQKLFFWDSIIFYLATAILGLSVSNVVVDFLRPEPNAVSCFTPFNYTRGQTDHVNNFCNEYLPSSENFSLALVAHGVLLLIPQYLWKAYFSARIDFFFSHAAKLETLRERSTGEYPHRNFNVVDYMHREFHERKDILIGYVIKLFSQLFIIVCSLAISSALFTKFSIIFDCFYFEATGSDRLMTRCSYSKLRFVSILRWIDYALLGLSVLAILYGLWWCLLRSHPELGHQETSQFCYDSCINSKHYKGKKWYHLKNDLHFLLVSLFATNAGLGRVFKSVQIANDISHELSAHLESLDNFDSMKHPQREADMEGNSANIFKEKESFAKVLFAVCKGIYDKQQKAGLNVSKMGAMDIGCGYHSYLFAIARWQKQVISIILDPYYRNQNDIFKSEEYHAGVILMRIPTNLFGLPKKHKFKFSQKIQDYCGLNDPPDVVSIKIKFSLVVVGPLDSDRKVNTVNQIIEMHSRSSHYFEKGSIMLIFRPLKVGKKDISKGFADWKPESIEFWQPSDSLCDLKNWLSKEDLPVISADKFEDGSGELAVLCGGLKCTFLVKTYHYLGYNKTEALSYSTA